MTLLRDRLLNRRGGGRGWALLPGRDLEYAASTCYPAYSPVKAAASSPQSGARFGHRGRLVIDSPLHSWRGSSGTVCRGAYWEEVAVPPGRSFVGNNDPWWS